jgi:photosystem II stability/assembly factor-like uncharacterized protein
MGIATPAYILKTTDGGETWKVVYKNKASGMFLDAMDFLNTKNGIVIGDPINNRFFMAQSFDGGNTWRETSLRNAPVADSGEACFAASGTNIKLLKKANVCFVSGGLKARLFIRDQNIDLPILQGKETTGANSLAAKNKKTFIVVGGDFNTPHSTEKNCVITFDKGRTWKNPLTPPHGYRSCVEYINKNSWITCGSNGVDYSTDNGNTWKLISTEDFNVCKKAKKGKTIFFAGNGKIGKFI